MAAIKRILDRADAEIVSIRKWDDRRLAYEIQHVGRGTYILVYFRAEGQYIQGIEKAVQLSEKILRVLILNAEHMTEEDMAKDTPAIKAEKEEKKPAPTKELDEEDDTETEDDFEEESESIEDETEDDTGMTESEQAEEDEQTDEDEEESQPKLSADD